FEARGKTTSPRQFIGERLILDETMLVRRPSGPLVGLHGLHFAPIQAGQFSVDKEVFVAECHGAALSPPFQQLKICRDFGTDLGLLLVRSCAMDLRLRERVVEAVISELDMVTSGPEQRATGTPPSSPASRAVLSTTALPAACPRRLWMKY